MSTLLIYDYKITKKELYYTYFVVFFYLHFSIFHFLAFFSLTLPTKAMRNKSAVFVLLGLGFGLSPKGQKVKR